MNDMRGAGATSAMALPKQRFLRGVALTCSWVVTNFDAFLFVAAIGQEKSRPIRGGHRNTRMNGVNFLLFSHFSGCQ